MCYMLRKIYLVLYRIYVLAQEQYCRAVVYSIRLLPELPFLPSDPAPTPIPHTSLPNTEDLLTPLFPY